MGRSRRDRLIEYRIFYELASKFEKYISKDPRHHTLKERVQFHVMPGGPVRTDQYPGGVDERTVQIQYGLSAIGGYREITSMIPFRVASSTVVERGATLVFSRSDDYSVLAILYPPRTDNMRATDEAYVIGRMRAGKNLTSIAFLEWCARCLLSSQQVWSFDGEPNFSDRLMAIRLKYFHRYVSDGKTVERRASVVTKNILKWTATVVLSGILLKAVEEFWPSTPLSVPSKSSVVVK